MTDPDSAQCALHPPDNETMETRNKTSRYIFITAGGTRELFSDPVSESVKKEKACRVRANLRGYYSNYVDKEILIEIVEKF